MGTLKIARLGLVGISHAFAVAGGAIKRYFDSLNKGNTGGQLKDIFTKQIPSWAHSMAVKVGSHFGLMRQKIGQAIGWIKNVDGGKLWGFFVQAVPRWAGTMSFWVKVHWQAVANKVSSVVTFLVNVVGARIFDFFVRAVPRWAGTLSYWVKIHWQAIANKVGSVVNYLVHVVGARIFDFFVRAVPRWAGTLSYWVKTHWQAIANKVNSVVSYLVHVLGARIFDFFVRAVPRWAGTLSYWVKIHWQAIANKVNSVVNYLVHVLGARIFDFFVRAIPRWTGTLAARVKALWQSIANKLNSVVRYLVHVLGARIFDFFVRAIPRWTGNMAGKVKSLWQSMLNAIGKIWNKLKAMAAKPIVFVIETVIKNGIMAAVKKVADVFGLSDISKKVKGAQAGLGTLLGQIKRSYATGGWVRGPGGPTEDKIPAMLSDGEYVIRARAVKSLGLGTLETMNRWGKVPGHYNGGQITPFEGKRRPYRAPMAPLPFASGGAPKALDWAKKQLGKPYVFGAHGPHAFDCSGLVEQAYKHAYNVSVGMDTYAQWRHGKRIGRGSLNYGDPVFENFNGERPPGHVGMYAGGNKIINAPTPGRPVEYDNITNVVGYRKFVNQDSGGGFLSFVGGLLSSAIDWVKDVYNKYLKNAITGLDSPQAPKGVSGDMIKGVIKATWKAGQDKLKELVLASNGGGGPADFSGNVAKWVTEALKLTHTPESWRADIYRIIKRESGGNPRAINNYDINAKNGIPSQGLMQTIPPVFKKYHMPGTSWNILDPVANIAAAIRYIKGRYGSIKNTPHNYYAEGGLVKPNQDGGHDNGGWAMPGFNYNGTGKPEMFLNEAQGKALERRINGDGPLENLANFGGAELLYSAVKLKSVLDGRSSLPVALAPSQEAGDTYVFQPTHVALDESQLKAIQARVAQRKRYGRRH